MTIKLDPKLTALVPREGLGEAAATDAAPQQKKDDLRAMEKPQMLAQPDVATNRPAPGRRIGVGPKFQREAAALLAQLRAKEGDKMTPAQQALALCASYTMRRSKGSRRMALDLLEEVCEQVEDEEVAELAAQLRHVLLAEAYLHQNTAEATLRAVQALVNVLDDGEDRA